MHEYYQGNKGIVKDTVACFCALAISPKKSPFHISITSIDGDGISTVFIALPYVQQELK